MVNLWSNVTEQPIPVIKSGTCANVIADSTRSLQQCVQEQLTHLDNRARALATCGSFGAALKDVARIRQLVPSSAMGYLCAGHVYSLQGRQKAAINIYDKGLAAVSSSDPSHQQLVEARSMAQQRDRKRIDFINELPLDIIMNIAPWILSTERMAPSEIREYLDVSRVWREKLLSCVRELHVLSTTNDSHLDADGLPGLIATYCTTLTLESRVTCLRDFISDARYPLLKALNINQVSAGDNYDEYGYCGSRHFLDIVASFRYTATLTRLRIFAGESYFIPFGDILNNCPSLVDLETTYISANMSTAPASCPNLKSLSFMLNKYQDLDMDDITKRLPGLERLVTSPFQYAKDLGIIQDNCPKLEVIGSHGSVGFPATSNYDDTPTTMVGVRMLYIHDYETRWSDLHQGEIEHVVEFMQQNSDTLQDISFCTTFPYNDEESDGHSVVADSNAFTFTRMTSYKQQEIYVPEHLCIARMVVQKSPHLKSFELVRGFDHDDLVFVNAGELFDYLVGICTLESAIIKLPNKCTLMYEGGMERFIQYHSRIDTQLHTLILPQYTRLSNDALDALTTLPRLKTLGFDLSTVQGEDDEDGKKASRFIQKLRLRCPQLQHLEVVSDAPIPDIVFAQLSKLNIKSLHLIMLSLFMHNAPTSLLNLLECPQLQELHIYPPYRITKNRTNTCIRTKLESKIPRLSW
ncbi:hypothetical protein O0I10_012772 [Lichtheimia ornata]|uniref:F-box domain-containing protein n=1 Tax=Lichtheimia ornata TaxID=688661 RepID=A0AAD7UR51_9FUNG|nr:uncharacterized protein O0I10_012772 [Lichtheimia ornata]KAJ8651655.1 hypothetical protein O0I10_012772 [Lichtheimia ornata]